MFQVKLVDTAPTVSKASHAGEMTGSLVTLFKLTLDADAKVLTEPLLDLATPPLPTAIL
jgi:hypothetical protein